jgi:hypothetical protein
MNNMPPSAYYAIGLLSSPARVMPRVPEMTVLGEMC